LDVLETSVEKVKSDENFKTISSKTYGRPKTTGECGIFFKHLGSMSTNDGRCACEIKSRIAMAKAAFNKKRAQNGLGTEEETGKMLDLECSFVWRWNWDGAGSRSEIPGKF
jgi:hypothetical protein